jgi:hypothetical protein
MEEDEPKTSNQKPKDPIEKKEGPLPDPWHVEVPEENNLWSC